MVARYTGLATRIRVFWRQPQWEFLISGAVDILVDKEFQQQLPELWLRKAVSAALEVASPDGETCEVSLVVTGDEVVRKLNRDYRGLDGVTDVLSFSPLHSGHWEGESTEDCVDLDPLEDEDFIYPPGEPTPLGEVVISLPQAERQASERSQPLDREMALLVVHGILHLAGHDHVDLLDEINMKSKEQAALKSIPRVEIPWTITP